MRIEDQVCTVDQAKKLVDLGVDLCAVYSWRIAIDANGEESNPKLTLGDKRAKEDGSLVYPAPTVAELGVLLPTEISLEDEDVYLQGTIGNRQGEFYYIWFQSSVDQVEWDMFPAIEKDTEAEARAAALIWLIENDYISPSSLKL